MYVATCDLSNIASIRNELPYPRVQPIPAIAMYGGVLERMDWIPILLIWIPLKKLENRNLSIGIESINPNSDPRKNESPSRNAYTKENPKI